jgi:pimeloyl-ACP methyl ester carboxylesterase
MKASDNWWGSPLGPASSTIKGAVITSPWLLENPLVKKCCSNVLFLPGLEASRLEVGSNRLWEPNRNDDVRKLHLDSTGTSIDSTIYTGDIIGSALGILPIYKNFIAFMDGVVAEKKINAWLPFAYDWRMPVDKVVTGETVYASSTKILIEEALRLAEKSQTHKITIVAHSNGGLLAKMLGRELEKRGKAHIIDKVVFVGVPELGTPQAIAALLHGKDQAIGKGLIARAAVMRTFGLNMQGAYGLLPSSEFFSRITDPVLRFAEKAVSSYDSFADFLTALGGTRLQPAESDLKTPAVLSSALLGKAREIHSSLDTWRFATTTEVAAIVGWGAPTTKTIEYTGSTSPRYKKTLDGDSTVLAASAMGYTGQSSGNSIYFDLPRFNSLPERAFLPIDHADLLQATPILSFIGKVIATSTIASVINAPLPQYLSHEKPKVDLSSQAWLTASVHSPVDIDIYDSKGGHMGYVPVPGYPDSDLRLFENTIGGYYDRIGDEKYYTVPAGESYSVKLKGTGVGSFTYQVQKFTGEDMTEVSNTLYGGLPVTPLLEATTTLGSTLDDPLHLDVDGNGTADITTGPGATFNPLIHIDAMKTIVASLGLKKGIEQSLLARINRIQGALERDPKKFLKGIETMVEKSIEEHWSLKTLTDKDRQLVVGMFETLLANLERL